MIVGCGQYPAGTACNFMGELPMLPAMVGDTGTWRGACDYPGGASQHTGESDADFAVRMNQCIAEGYAQAAADTASGGEPSGEPGLWEQTGYRVANRFLDRLLPPPKPPAQPAAATPAWLWPAVGIGGAVVLVLLMKKRRRRG